MPVLLTSRWTGHSGMLHTPDPHNQGDGICTVQWKTSVWEKPLARWNTRNAGVIKTISGKPGHRVDSIHAGHGVFPKLSENYSQHNATAATSGSITGAGEGGTCCTVGVQSSCFLNVWFVLFNQDTNRVIGFRGQIGGLDLLIATLLYVSCVMSLQSVF